MKLTLPLLVLLSLVAISIALDDTPPRADLVIANRSDIFTLDPQRMSYLKDFNMAYALYEGLVRWNNDDFTIQPAAADSLPRVSTDGRTYTFHLRGDARWSNGDPVLASDFAYAWMRAMLPDTAADYSSLFFMIEGARDLFDWRAQATRAHAMRVFESPEERDAAAQALWRQTLDRFDSTVGVSVVDDRTLRITLDRPVAYALDLFCFPVFYPVHQPAVEGWMTDGRLDARRAMYDEPPPFGDRRFVSLNPATARLEQKHDWQRPGRIVCNGPYVLDAWRYKRDLRLVRNEHFHSPDIVASDSVVVLTIEDTNTAVLAFESGGIDWLTDVNAEYQADMLAQRRAYEARYASELERLQAGGATLDEAIGQLPPPGDGERRNIHAFPSFGTDFYSFNCRPTLGDGRVNPFATPAVRRAFAQSVDKRAIVEQITRLGEPVIDSFIPIGSIPGYDSPEGLPFDIAQARGELRQAGWEDRDADGLIENEAGEPFPVIDLLYTTGSPRYKWISLELKSQWERALGVRIELRAKETKFYKEDLKEGKFMIARGRWYGDYGDPTTFLDLFRTGNGNNDRGYSNPAVDAMLDRAESELDSGRRLEALQACEQYLFEVELPLVPVCQLLQIYMYEPGEVTGISGHPRLAQYLWRIGRVEHAGSSAR